MKFPTNYFASIWEGSILKPDKIEKTVITIESILHRKCEVLQCLCEKCHDLAMEIISMDASERAKFHLIATTCCPHCCSNLISKELLPMTKTHTNSILTSLDINLEWSLITWRPQLQPTW